MTESRAANGRSRNVVLAAMIFAVAMTFIDQTIVAIAAPNIQKRGSTSRTQSIQWAVNTTFIGTGRSLRFWWPARRHRGSLQDGRARGDRVRLCLGYVRPRHRRAVRPRRSSSPFPRRFRGAG